MSDTAPITILGKGIGYGILVGLGAVFAIGMILITKLMTKYLHENHNSTETFMVANRSIGKWWMASCTYSSWTWATEFLFVTTAVQSYGIQASYYYSAGLCIQMCLMNIIGTNSKKKIPTAHTSLEIVEIRYGKVAHFVFMFFALVTSLISCSDMILGAAGAINVIGDVHIVASSLLIPFGVLVYTSFSGLRGTIITDFIHSFILLIVLCYLNTSILTSEKIGGLSNLYDLVFQHQTDTYIEGNYEGSFLTSKSKSSIIFGLILSIGNFGLSLSTSFWQKAFSATPKASFPGYLTASIAIFSNAWPLGAIVGSAALVLEGNPVFPTYPRKMTTYEVQSGLVLPYTIKATIGNNAVGALLLILYLAVTSTASAEMMAASSIISFDIYKKYINPKATNSQIIRVSHISVVCFGLFCGGFSVMLHYVGINMTWFGYFLSIVICPGVLPLVFTILWDRQTKIAAIVSPIIGLMAGIVVWLTTALHYSGTISIESLNGELPCLFGGLTSLFLPGVLSIIISLAYKPHKYDWNKFKEAQLTVVVEEEEKEKEEAKPPETDYDSTSNPNGLLTNSDSNTQAGSTLSNLDIDKKNNYSVSENKDSSTEGFESEARSPEQNNDILLDKYRKWSVYVFFFVLLITWVIWPLSLYRDYIWTKAYYQGYITMSLIWLYCTLIVIGFFPLYEGRRGIATVVKGIFTDYIKRKKWIQYRCWSEQVIQRIDLSWAWGRMLFINIQVSYEGM